MKGIKLGTQVCDNVTGIVGVATGRTEWLNGCARYCVERVLDGKVVTDWFDEERLGVATAEECDNKPGGPRTDPQQPTGGRP